MLDYNTCVALKKAGFPQFTSEDLDYYNYKFIQWYSTEEMPENSLEVSLKTRDAEDFGECVRIPTLENLLNACREWFKGEYMEDIGCLQRGLFYDFYDQDWACVQKHQNLEDFEYISDGKTPEEAVANLFLAINK
jgi:hypothetical protein